MNAQAIAQSIAETRLFLCLKDNYGVLVHDPATGATAAIDAPEAAPVEDALAALGLEAHRHPRHPSSWRPHRRHCGLEAQAWLPGSWRRARRRRKFPDVDVTVGEGDTVTVGDLAGRSHRDARPHARPDQLFLPRRQAAVRRRHPVLDRLRPGDRGHAGTDVAVAAQVARAAGRYAPLLRPRIHRSQYPFRHDDRARQRGAESARCRGPTASRSRVADNPDPDGRGEARQCLSCAPTIPRSPRR